MKKLTHFFNTAYLYREKKIPYFSFFVNFFNKLMYVFFYLQLKTNHFFTLTDGGYIIFLFFAYLNIRSIVHGFDLIFPVNLFSYAIGIGVPICCANLYFLFKIKGVRQYFESLFGEKNIREFFDDKSEFNVIAVVLVGVVLIVAMNTHDFTIIDEYIKASNAQFNEAVVNNEITADMGDFLLNDIKENMSKTRESVRKEIVTEIIKRLKH